jgi:uncharacterized protein
MDLLLLILLGFVVGLFGTLIGVGGGILLIPALLYLYPVYSTEMITGISLAVVFINALAGSTAYGRMGRIHYPSGLLFAAATIPGAIFGAYSSSFIPRRIFDALFGILLIAASLFIMVKPKISAQEAGTSGTRFQFRIALREKNGTEHTLSYNYLLGIALSLCIGYVSSVLGIGGGIIHVPVLVSLLHFPAHIATATSHFVLMVTAGTGTFVHLATGTLLQGFRTMLPLAVGVLIGAPLGAKLSNRVRDTLLMRLLSLALLLVGIRIVLRVF